jgi:hypothetical protein
LLAQLYFYRTTSFPTSLSQKEAAVRKLQLQHVKCELSNELTVKNVVYITYWMEEASEKVLQLIEAYHIILSLFCGTLQTVITKIG